MRLIPFFFGLAVILLSAIPAGAQAVKEKEKEKDNGSLSEFAGKSFEQWMREISAKDPGKGEAALRVVQAYGPDRAYQAIPIILRELTKHSVAYPIDVGLRANLVTALGAILGGVKDPDPKYVKEAVNLLRKSCKDSQYIVRCRAAQSLGALGPAAFFSLQELIDLTREAGSWETRQTAFQSLRTVAVDPENKKSPPDTVIKTLYFGLQDRSAPVRIAAIQSLAALGGAAEPTLKQALEKALEPVAAKDGEPEVQIWAQMALMNITGTVASDRVTAIAKLLQHEEKSTRAQAAQAIGMLGPTAKVAVPALTAALTDLDPNVVGTVIWALSRMEMAATSALPALKKMSDDQKQPEPLRKAAAEASELIEGKKKDKK